MKGMNVGHATLTLNILNVFMVFSQRLRESPLGPTSTQYVLHSIRNSTESNYYLSSQLKRISNICPLLYVYAYVRMVYGLSDV